MCWKKKITVVQKKYTLNHGSCGTLPQNECYTASKLNSNVLVKLPYVRSIYHFSIVI